MPEHYRALVVILAVALAVFTVARKPLGELAMSTADFKRRRNLWFFVTLTAFLSPNIWVYATVSGFVLLLATARERNALALYFLVLFVVPSGIREEIPGIGPIEHIFELRHVRLLSLVILLPAAVGLLSDRKGRGAAGYKGPDLAIVAFVIVSLLGEYAVDPRVTGLARNAFYAFIDIWLPYYVASRGLKSARDLREAFAAFVLAAAVLGVLAIFENLRGWLLYAALPNALDAGGLTYNMRGSQLRAEVTAGHSIALGYVLTAAWAMSIYFLSEIRNRWHRRVLILALVGGLIASLSRGPWMGAALMLVVLWAMLPGIGVKLKRALVGGIVAAVLLVVLPIGEQIIQYLPFVGRLESGNVDYRVRLIEVSMEVYWQNPILGDAAFVEDPRMEQLRQGEGIIDVVNTYIDVLVSYGIVGFSLFLTALVSPWVAVWKTRRACSDIPDAERMGRSLFAAMSGILLIIATVSSVHVIPTIYWLFAGLCTSYARVYSAANRAEQAVTPAGRRTAAHGAGSAAVK